LRTHRAKLAPHQFFLDSKQEFSFRGMSSLEELSFDRSRPAQNDSSAHAPLPDTRGVRLFGAGKAHENV
jgi:hypothetical protein